LSAFSEELSAVRVEIDGLRVEVHSELEVIVDESLLRLFFEIGCHRSRTEREREKEESRMQGRYGGVVRFVE
jgi:hypothetical protein